MKIEPTGLQPLAAKPAEKTASIEKRDEVSEAEYARAGQDKVEMSDHARLLAKARAALGNVEEVDAERLALLKQQIQSGDYTVQVSDLARKIAARFFNK